MEKEEHYSERRTQEKHYSERSLFLLPTSRPDSAAAPGRRRPGVL
jgi:hypothetical protein